MSVKTVTEIHPIIVEIGNAAILQANTIQVSEQMTRILCDETVEVTHLELSLLKTTCDSFRMVESLTLLFQTVQAK